MDFILGFQRVFALQNRLFLTDLCYNFDWYTQVFLLVRASQKQDFNELFILIFFE